VSPDKPRLQEPHSIQDQNIAIINNHIDQPYSKKVCPDYQKSPGGQGPLTVYAARGSLFKPHYLKPELPRTGDTQKGYIDWYGTREVISFNTTTFDDILGFQEGRNGQGNRKILLLRVHTE
jgi:hypothetical protein